MTIQSWVLPILIGFIAAFLLIAILFKDNLKQRFSDLGALIQLQTSRPYYGLGYVPINYDATIPPGAVQGQITNTDSPVWVDSGVPYPIYNWYPKAPLNPTPTNTLSNKLDLQKEKQDNLAYPTPDQTYNSHKAYYWALSGGYPYPYPYPVMVMPPTNMDNVRGIENKI